MARIVPDKTAGESVGAQLDMFSPLPAGARVSVTHDNGTEFAHHERLRDGLGMATYFADPYSSWQRGSNENRNGMIRRYLPKRCEIRMDMAKEVREIVDEINNRPMRALGYRTPAEAFADELLELQDQQGCCTSGSIVFSQTQALNMAFPNQTVYDAGQAGEGTAPETVDFTVLNPDTYNVAKAQGTAAFPISGTSKIDNRDGGTTFNGEVRAVADGFKPSDGQQIKISLVLRNAQNAIIYGDITFVDWPGNGRSAPFSITVYDLPKYASYDLYAQIG